MPMVSFGVNNFNRLYYLRSCTKTLMESVSDYKDVEFICIDDNSSEPGTHEYLEYLKSVGWKVINQQEYRTAQKKVGDNNVDHIAPFSEALNIIYKESSGKYVAPLQGDSQFVRHNWLDTYVRLFETRGDVGCIQLDAQRKQRLSNSSFTRVGDFAIDHSRERINGAGDCVYSREMVDSIGGWHIGSGINAEDDFSERVTSTFGGRKRVYIPWIPVCVGIYTDSRGTNARVRGDKRYGSYWQASDDMYYSWTNYPLRAYSDRPYSIEEIALPNGTWPFEFDSLTDEHGNWKKSPIDISSAGPGDYEVI